MGDFDATVIVGQLDSKELISSIDKLVSDVADRSQLMANKFEGAMEKMKSAMKDFAVTQKVSVDLMKESWRQMSSSFDAMVAAQSNATGSGRKTTNNGGGASFPDNTVGNLKEVIALEENRRLGMERGTQELRDQNKLIADQKQQLKEELMTEEEKRKAIEKQNEALERQKAKQLKQQQQPFVENFNKAASMSATDLATTERKLKEMIKAIDAMRKSGLFNETELNNAQRKIDAIKKKIESLRQSRPKTMREILGMDENGIDAITAKMKALKQIRLDPNDAKQASQLSEEYARLKRRLAELQGQNIQATHSNNYLAQSFGYIRNRIVYALTLGAITNFTKQIYDIRGQYELLERSLGVLTNSFQKGSQIFQELNDMAIKSPFTLMELATAAKQLTAYNFAADEVVDTTRRLADISAALGVPMERLTYNLGQIRAQTVLTARDARDFANAGLPMVKTLADYYTELEGRVVSTGDVYDRMSKKMVSYADVMAVLNKMTDEGGKFFDFQAKQAETLKVQMNNLTLAWNNMLNEIGKDNQSLLELPLKGLRTIFENWESVNRALTNLVVILGTAKVAQLAFNMALGKGNIEQLRSIALMPKATMTNYKNALSKMEITKAQAKLMVATNRGNENLQKAIIKMKLLTKTEVEAAASTNALRNSWTIFSNTIAIGAAKIGKGLMALATNPATWIFAATYAVTDFISSIGEASEKAKEFNDTIGKNATENANSIGKFLDDYAKSFDKLRDGKMEQTEQVKLWEAIREEIKKSSQNADDYIAKLERLNDFNERNTKGGEFLSTIKQIQEFANAAQEQGLIKANEDSWIEAGLDKDLKAWADEISSALRKAENDFDGFTDKYEKVFDIVNNPSNYNNGAILQWENNLASATEKAQSNLDVFTQSIAESMEKMWNPNVEKNATNIREYVNTIVKAYKDAHPTIKGQAERFLDINVDKFVAKQVRTFATVKDKNDEFLQETYSSWRIFYDKLRSEGGQEFDGLMQYVTKTGDYSNKEFEKVWKKAAETMKREAGDAYATIDKYIADLNTRKIVVPVLFQQKQIEGDELQKDFTQHFIEDGLNLMKDEKSYQQEMLRRTRLYKDLNKKEGEETLKWNKRLNSLYNDDLANIAKQDEIMGKITDKESVRYKQAEATKKYYTQQVNAIKEVAEYEGFTLGEEKKKGGRKGKDEILDALKNEIELIKKAQSEYETLTKKGYSANEALASAQSKFGKTLNLLNSKLSHWGLPTIDLSKIIKGDPNKTLAFFEKVRDVLESKGLSNIERMKALEVVIDEFDLKAKTFNIEKVTKGIEKELNELKEKYSLAIEIDANPEEGAIFADFMKLDKNELAQLPRSFGQLMARLQESINKQFSDNGIGLKFDLSEMINNEKFKQWVTNNGHTLEDGMIKSLNAVREYLNGILKDETAQLGEIVSKYGEASVKIEKIYAQNTRKVLSVISTYGDINDKSLGINLADQLSISKDPETVARLRDELKTLAQNVADKSEGDAAQNLLDAIFKNEKENVAKTLWEGFKGGDYYSIIFDDVSRASTTAIQTMKSQLDDLKDKIKESPESMKALMSAYSKLREELIERNPFQGIADGLNNMRIAHTQTLMAMAELEEANKELKQKEDALNALRKKEPNNLMAINRAEKELAKTKKSVAEKSAKVVKAQNDEVAAQEDYKKAIKEANAVIKKLSDALKDIGSTLGNTTGEVIKFIGDILNFVTFVSESMTTVSQNASKAIQTIEKASVILTIISAAIQLIQELNSLIPDASDQYKKAAEKQAEINSLTHAIMQYRLAVMAARMEEENWFSASALKQLKSFYSIGREALRDYNEQLMESQAIYQNEQSGGWLTKFAYWTNPATWIKEVTGIEGKWADAIALVGSGLMGAEAQMGQLGIWLTQHVNDDVYDYEEGFTAAFNNLRIETKARSKGFLGTGIGGHAQETEDLIKWVRENLKTELFDPDFMLNEEAYQTLMDKYADKLVGETKATLESLHELQEKWNEYIKQLEEYVDSMYSPIVDNMTDALWAWYDDGKSALDSFREYASDTFRDIVTDMMKTIILSNFAEEYANDIKKMYKEYSKGGMSEQDLITYVAQRTGSMMEDFNAKLPILEQLLNVAGEELEKYGIILRNGSASDSLSSLQAGIQGITEDTAGAIEAYLNIVSQRIFYHGTLLEQIRDTLVGFDLDLSLGIQSQMLLQLQNSYQTQMAIQNLLEGTLTPNGRAFMVELNS